MDVEKRGDTRWHFSLGPVERWIVLLGATALVGGFVGAGKWFAGKVDAQGEQIETLVIQQAVANQSLTTISAQLSDVPQLRRDVVELKVRVEALEEGQKELRGTRGLR